MSWVPLGLAAFGLVLVLPGFGMGWLLERAPIGRRVSVLPARERSTGGAFVLAIAWSAIVAAVAGATMLSLGVFSGLVLAVVLAALAALGARDLVRATWRSRGGWPVALFVVVLALPWILSVTSEGFPPAQTFQWYYWDLGRQLDLVGGVPAWVAEYGLRLEWLPNYVLSDVASAAYRGFFPPAAEVAALVAWRVPTLMATLGALYLVSRLWLDRSPALVTIGAAGASGLVLTKFSSYRPEALGVLLGLLALWLVVRGLRDGERPKILLAGALIGLAAGFHPISTTALGLLVASAAVVEWRGGSAAARRPMLGALVRAALLAAAVALSTGWVLQGRLSPVQDAAIPAVSGTSDPTWSFLSRSEGLDPETMPPSRGDQLLTTLREPWPGIDLAASPELIVPILLGLLAALRWSPRRVRRLASVTLLAAGLLSVPIAGFALQDTYVPQYTGLVRLSQYALLLLALAVGLAFEGYRAAATSLGMRLETPVPGVLAVGVMVAAWLVPTVSAEFARAPRIGEDGLDALATARRVSSPGDVLLSNAATRGTIAFFTRREVPLESRQPVLEDPAVLEFATEQLTEADAFFDDPARQPLPKRVAARWILVTECPASLGATHAYGSARGAPARVRAAGRFEQVWRRGCIALFEDPTGRRNEASVGPPSLRPRRLLVVTVALGVIAVLPLLASRRRAGGTAGRARGS